MPNTRELAGTAWSFWKEMLKAAWGCRNTRSKGDILHFRLGFRASSECPESKNFRGLREYVVDNLDAPPTWLDALPSKARTWVKGVRVRCVVEGRVVWRYYCVQRVVDGRLVWRYFSPPRPAPPYPAPAPAPHPSPPPPHPHPTLPPGPPYPTLLFQT